MRDLSGRNKDKIHGKGLTHRAIGLSSTAKTRTAEEGFAVAVTGRGEESGVTGCTGAEILGERESGLKSRLSSSERTRTGEREWEREHEEPAGPPAWIGTS